MRNFIADVCSFVITALLGCAAFSVIAFVLWAAAYLVKVAR